MRKLSALVVALIAMLVVGGVTANAAKKKVVAKSKVTLQFSEGPNDGVPPYYEEALFKGKVKATKVKVKGYEGKAKKKAKKKAKAKKGKKKKKGKKARSKAGKCGTYMYYSKKSRKCEDARNKK
jgi:hypothetical protein